MNTFINMNIFMYFFIYFVLLLNVIFNFATLLKGRVQRDEFKITTAKCVGMCANP